MPTSSPSPPSTPPPAPSPPRENAFPRGEPSSPMFSSPRPPPPPPRSPSLPIPSPPRGSPSIHEVPSSPTNIDGSQVVSSPESLSNFLGSKEPPPPPSSPKVSARQTTDEFHTVFNSVADHFKRFNFDTDEEGNSRREILQQIRSLEKKHRSCK